MKSIPETDYKIISTINRISLPYARIALFVVYFWFGLLKFIGLSPANPIVGDLLSKTLPFLSFEEFILFFSVFEMFIGALFLVRGLERLVMPLLAIHMVMTTLPLIFLPQSTWESFLVPTLEGQYIIKNLVIIGLALAIVSRMQPLKLKGK